MKKFLIGIALVSATSLAVKKAEAQVSVSINIGAQPQWGPVGYNYVDYYYLPDIEAYYYVPQRQYIYLDGPRWVFAPALPPRFSGYDIYRGYKVVINQPKPYLQHATYQARYKKYKGAYGKQVILKNKPYKGNNGNAYGNGHGNGAGKSKGKGKGKGKH